MTPKYRLEIDDANGTHNQAWSGKASDGRLRAYVFSYADSLKASGCNSHIAKSLGFIPFPNFARIVRQSDAVIVASWKAGVFQIF